MKTILEVKNMHCEGCENRIKNVLSTIPGINDVKASYEDGIVEITSNENVDLNLVKEKLQNLDFEVVSVKENENE